MRLKRNFAMHMIPLTASVHRLTEDPSAGVGKSEFAPAHRSAEDPSAGVGNLVFGIDWIRDFAEVSLLRYASVEKLTVVATNFGGAADE